MARDKAARARATNVQQRRQDGTPILELTSADVAGLHARGPARGAPGQDGEDGRRGFQGPPGPTGRTGASGSGSGGLLGIVRRLEVEEGRRGFPGPAGATGAPGSEFTTTSTGNVDDLDFQNATLIRFNNATDATLRGLKAGRPGQVTTVVSVGAGIVYLAHQNAGSGVANRLINAATSGTSPLAAGSGKAVYVYDGTTARWRLVAHQQGAYIAVVHSAGDYTTNDGTTWSIWVPTMQLAYQLRDGQLHIVGFIDWDLSANTPIQLQAKIPNSFSAIASAQALAFMKDNSVKISSRLSVSAAGTNVNITRLDGGAMTGSGGAPTFFGQNGFNLLFGVT